MKLTATQLRRIIAEEVSRLTEGVPMQTIEVTPYGKTPGTKMPINVGLNYSNTAVRVEFGRGGIDYSIELDPDAVANLCEAMTAVAEHLGGFGVQVTPGADEAPPVSTSMPGRRI